MVHKNIDITLMSIFTKFDFVPNYQSIKANNFKRWLHILERSFRFLYSLLHNHDTNIYININIRLFFIYVSPLFNTHCLILIFSCI